MVLFMMSIIDAGGSLLTLDCHVMMIIVASFIFICLSSWIFMVVMAYFLLPMVISDAISWLR